MDINAGPDNSYSSNFTLDGESLYFFATSAETGTEVWLINDKASLPQVIDIVPGEPSSFPSFLGFADGLYLNSQRGNYRLSGTTATLVSDYPRRSMLPIQGIANRLYFHTHAGDLSFYDGTNIQTVRTFGNVATLLGTTNESVLFIADDGISGLSIWKSDGTNAGTLFVLDPEPGTVSSSRFTYKHQWQSCLLYQRQFF